MSTSSKVTTPKFPLSPDMASNKHSRLSSECYLSLKNLDNKFQMLTTNLPKLPNTVNSSPIGIKNITSFESTKDLIWQDIQVSLGLKKPPERKNSFHKTNDFIERKQKIKKNVKDHKYKSSEKLRKLESIVEPWIENNDFLTNEDLINEEGSHFLYLNKRNFGQGPNPNPKFRSPKKVEVNSTGKLNSRNPSLPELPVYKCLSPHTPKDSLLSRKYSESPISVPVHNYINKEMKKLWPADSELISIKKQKNLKRKVENLSHIKEEPAKLSNTQKKKKRNLGDKLQPKSLVPSQYKSLKKKLDLYNLH